jgi:prepilin-type N-terminal cleavage/methylation domain-containing protein
MQQMNTNERAFTLVELIVAMALGLMVLAAVAEIFRGGLEATSLVVKRAEMQQNVRAGVNLIVKDVSMAGAGLRPGGLALPNGGGATVSRFACDQSGTCWLNNNGYPTGTIGTPPTPVNNYMYGLIPGPGNGMEKGGPGAIPATHRAADAITVIYVDYSFPLNQYQVTFPDNTGNTINLALPAPAPTPLPPPVDDPANGIKVGDLLMLSNSAGGDGWAVGEVTGITPGGGTITFGNLDPLNINQPGATEGNIASITCCSPTTAWRILAVTYFVEVPAAGQPPRLIRQVNGQQPVPVADNIIDLQFTYDMCDSVTTGPACANVKDPIAAGFTPSQIHKVNITLMGQSMLSGNKAQNMALVSSVSTRNLNFRDRYK